MKKMKILASIVSIAVALCLGASLAACASGNSEEDHTHQWESTSTTATCTKGGTTTYTCSICGETEVVLAAATGHNYTISATTATCTSAGTITYTCSYCGDSYTETVMQPLGHDYVAKATTASCTEAGAITYTCSRCGDSYTEVVSAASGHNYEFTSSTATCTEDGVATYTCSECGATKTETIPATGHDYEVTSTGATCTSAGTIIYTCSNCGDSYTETITQPVGHDYVATTTATCTEAGETTYTCSRCGDTYTEETPATGHNYKITTDATCTAGGKVTCTCTECGDTFTVADIDALGHSIEDLGETPATCTEAGYETYECTRCGDLFYETTSDPTGHDFSGEPVTSTDEEGNTIKTYTCLNGCGATNIEKVVSTEDGEDTIVNVWDGETIDYGDLIDLSSDDNTEDSEPAEVTVSTASQLAGLAAYVNGDYESADEIDNSLSDVEVTLDSDIDLAGEDWTPIGNNKQAFSGTFDGGNCTISNLSVEGSSDTGLFGYIDNDVIKDIVIENAEVSGTSGVGVIAGQLDKSSGDDGCVISGITIKGLIQISGNHYVGALGGAAYEAALEDITIDAEEGSYVKGVYSSSNNGSYVGGLLGKLESSSFDAPTGYTGETPYIKDVSVSGLDISGTMYVGGLIGSVDVKGGGFTIGVSDDSENTCELKNCTISITIVNDYVPGTEIGVTESSSSTTYIGAVIGYAKTNMSISDFEIDNITISYYNSKCVYAGTESGETTTNIGFYGGKASSVTVTLTSCTGSATLIDLLATDTEAEG